MPPKRKAAATKAKAGGKKAKKGEEDDISTSMKEAFEALKQADAGKKKKTKVDQHCPYANTASVSYHIVVSHCISFWHWTANANLLRTFTKDLDQWLSCKKLESMIV